MIKAVLFDMDDLMVDSAPLHIEASRRAFAPFGVDVRKIPDAVISSYFGKRTAEIQVEIAKYFGLDIDVAGLTKNREEIFIELVKKDLKPLPGLFELVGIVKKAGLKRAIASSGLKSYIDEVLKKFGLVDFFQEIVSGDMVKNGKPDPEIFLKAAKKLKVLPKECVVIEDAEAGILAAKKAGMRCIGVKNPNHNFTQVLRSADSIVDGLDKIDEDMLKGLKKGKI